MDIRVNKSRFRKIGVVGLCISLLLIPATAYGVPNFESAINYEVGAKPSSAAVGDFNNDGYPDMVTANAYDISVTVLLNDGHGEFERFNYSVGMNLNPEAVAVGDVNSDSILDVVTANGASNNVSVLLGKQEGGFEDAESFDTAIDGEMSTFTAASVTIGDFNNDNVADLAVANSDSRYGSGNYYVVILPGELDEDGTLTYGDPFPISVSDNPSSISVGDLNGDSDLDSLVVTNSGSNNVTILAANNGDLSISSTVYAVGNTPVASVIGDLNGDGIVDIAVASEKSNTISILQGEGQGSFKEAVDFAAGCERPSSLAIGDLDKDGKLDLAIGCETSASIAILVNNSMGSDILFQVADTYSVQGFGASVVIADFNLDSKLDVAAANFVPDTNINQVSFLFGNGDGTFQVPNSYAVGGEEPISIATSDFNGDGILDIATANKVSKNVSIMLGSGKGKFNAADIIVVGGTPAELVIGDFNLDGNPDLATANNDTNTITLLLNNGTGSFQKEDFVTNTAAGTKARTLAVGDFNSDGKPDIVVANTVSNSLSILIGNGKGKFETTNYTDDKIKSPRSVAVGDFNHDGKADLAIANIVTGKVYILQGQGNGTFTPGNEYGDSSAPPLSLAISDFNSDGVSDIAVTRAYSDELSILFGNKDGNLSEEIISSFSDRPLSLAVGDFNGDGYSDIVVTISFDDFAAVFMGGGHGGFTLENQYGTSNTPSSSAVGDFNKDGKEDVAIANQYSNSVTILNSVPPKWRVQLQATTFSAKEYIGGITVTVNRAGDSVGATSVVYATSDGSAVAGVQYTNTTGTLEFLEGETSKSFIVPIKNDDVYSGNKTFNVKISHPTADAVIVAPSTAVLTIEEDESPPTTPGSSSNPPSTVKPDNQIILDGVKIDDLAKYKEDTVAGQTVTTVTIDNNKIIAMVEKDKNKELVIPVNSNSDSIISELNGILFKTLENNGTSLEIRTNQGSYTLESTQLRIDDIASQFGNNIKLEDIKISIRLGHTSNDIIKKVNEAAKNGEVTPVGLPLEFEIVASYGGKEITIDRFNSYVKREIALPQGIDLTQITTGVVLNEDGTFSHVPTEVLDKDGQPFALINSLTNSIYTVIWNPKTFADVKGHWSQNDVNDMASRLVIQGVTPTSFKPDNAITRAEFLTIVVRGFGLKSGVEAEKLPKDVNASDWYASVVQAAVTYDLIQGYSDGTFRPTQTITRKEAAAVLSRAMAITKLDVKMTDDEVNSAISAYNDTESLSDWAKKALALMAKNGILKGNNNNLSPDSDLTRAETAAMVRRMLIKAKLINN